VVALTEVPLATGEPVRATAVPGEPAGTGVPLIALADAAGPTGDADPPALGCEPP
jgi:hypothetical protein